MINRTCSRSPNYPGVLYSDTLDFTGMAGGIEMVSFLNDQKRQLTLKTLRKVAPFLNPEPRLHIMDSKLHLNTPSIFSNESTH